MKKVFHINGGGDTGGGKSHLLSLLPRLREVGIDAQLVVFSRGLLAEEASLLGVPVHCLGFETLLSPTLLFRLVAFLKEHQPQVVHTHGGRANLYGRLAASLAGVPQVVTTIHSHSNLDYDLAWKNSLFATADRLTWSFAHDFIAVSEQLKTALVGRGLPLAKITVIHNGIEDMASSPSPYVRDVPRPVICAIGRLVSIKRFDVLLRALHTVASTGRKYTLLLIGDGPQRSELESLTASLGLIGKVVFAGYRTDAREILNSTDLFVMSSDMEGLPIVLLEAASAQVPVVATAVGGIPEVLVHEESGLLVPPGEPLALAAAISSALNAPVLARERAVRARQWFEEHATAQVMAEQTERVYTWGEVR